MTVLTRCCIFLWLFLYHSEVLPSPVFWGFGAHKFINRMAVYRLPPEMAPLFKKNIDIISENAVNPDRRRYSVVGEAEKHYIDLDAYGDSAAFLPRDWNNAVRKFGEDSLRKHGIAPWHLQQHVRRLTEAFRRRNPALIVKLATDMGHYIADIHVPLHTTRNYNGQFTGQEGIHAFWESRLPELYAESYDLWIGTVRYIENPAEVIWETVFRTHAGCDSVLRLERKISEGIPKDRLYSHEVRNNALVRLQSREFAEKYHRELDGQVERQMKAAIRLAGDLWYTCWVDAGQPELGTGETLYEDDSPDTTVRPLPQVRPEPDQ